MALRVLFRSAESMVLQPCRRFQEFHSKTVLRTFSLNKLDLLSKRTLSQEQNLQSICMHLKTLFHYNASLQRTFFSTTTVVKNADDIVNITYIDREGEAHCIKGKVGDNVMYLAQKHDLDVEGACEASLACCTCHVYVENHFDKLNEIDEEEEDMLDLAPFLQENSRLSCQIILDKTLEGIVVRLPSATRNFYVDGHKPKPH